MTSHSPSEPQTATVLSVSGMKCAGCVRAVEKRLQQQPGVSRAVVNLVTEQAAVEYVPQAVDPNALAQLLTTAGFPSQVRDRDPASSAGNGAGQAPGPKAGVDWQSVQRLIFAAMLVVLSGVGHLGHLPGFALPGSIQFHWGLATLALLGPGRSILWEGWQGLRHNLPNMNTLVSLGSVTAYLASVVAVVWPQLHWDCFFDAPVMIVGLILLGRALEAQARGRTKASLENLLALQPMVARWLPDPEAHPDYGVDVPVQDVQMGACLQISPGDKFPVDGQVRSGHTLVDEAMLTGEAMPVAKAPGDEVVAGTLNQSGLVTIAATRTGQQTTLAQIIKLVETAQTRKAPIQQFADRVAGYFTYGVLAIATLTFLFWVGIGVHLWPDVIAQGTLPMIHDPEVPAVIDPGAASILLGLKLAIAVLVIACPCALGLATPTAILVGTSLGAERGLLIRGGDVLEQVHQLDTIVFDKTGTLTSGHPKVTDYWLSESPPDLPLWESPLSPETVLQMAATLEVGGRHPLATAILDHAQTLSVPLWSTTALEVVPGAGVCGQVEQWTAHLGSATWLQQCGIEIPVTAQQQALAQAGKSVVYLAVANTYLGGIAVQDTLKPDAAPTIRQLQEMGLHVKMLTGDQAATAEAMAPSLHLEMKDIEAEVNPMGKATAIVQLQAQGHKVGMVGDGINDAPALAQADVGIALSGGTDVAIETAQIILMPGHTEARSLSSLVDALRLSQATFRKIQQNLFWAFVYNLIGLPIAAGLLLPQFGILLSPAVSAAIMAFSSVSVVTNSLRLRRLSF
ncbi:heavy metal translocating P-type ATPase [Acaryochloris sp. IP29b_bin.148]|uniref:heavy metal translocating P-type ATPase n=1 Tax=Acaryochloris sp. IP29b_bin.148 TaxID=2969218 RepID=UPI002622BDCF|nr:heavy metal translocating P-type ATPase [Acaryochloris sp. IP29b_bin.148]